VSTVASEHTGPADILFSKTHLILLPLSQPPNALLTSPPAPLSSAMPAHSQAHNASAIAQDDDGFIGKFKNMFRSGSSSAPPDRRPLTGNIVNPKVEGTAAAQKPEPPTVEAINDQTGSGEQMPDARGNAMGATTLNANAELKWPGTINGEKLGAIVVNLGGLDRAQVKMGGKKNEAAWVTIPVGSCSVSLYDSQNRRLNHYVPDYRSLPPAERCISQRRDRQERHDPIRIRQRLDRSQGVCVVSYTLRGLVPLMH